MSWTPEREAEARRLWAAGASASAIARDLGGVTRVAVIGKIHRMGLGREVAPAKPKPDQKAKPVCTVAGCGNVLSVSNVTGVCLTCQQKGVSRRAEPVQRPNVRVVEVPYPTSNSGVALRARVSLPREPWLMGTTP